jgi:PAS domain S-box-containing protein
LTVISAFFLTFGIAPRERRRAVNRWQAQLSAMADDRKAAIDYFIAAGLGEASYLARFLPGFGLTEKAPSPGSSALDDLRARVLSEVASQPKAGTLSDVAVFDAEARLLVTTRSQPGEEPETVNIVKLVLAQRKPLADISRNASGKAVIEFAAPILRETSGPVLGVVVLTKDPDEWLFPFLRHQPLASRTEETLLLARKGESVVFLTPLMHEKAFPLTVHRQLFTPRLAGSAAVSGTKGFDQFVDYRGEEVFAAIRHLDNASWALVAKVDRTEVKEDYEASIYQAGFVLLGVCIGFGAALLGIRNALESRARSRIAEAEIRFGFLLKNASDPIFLVGPDGRIRDFNRRATEMYGYEAEKLRGMHVSSLRADKERDGADRRTKDVLSSGGMVWESLHSDREGRELQVEIAARVVDLEGEKIYVSIVRDISERKRVETKIRNLNADLERRVAERTQELARLNEDLRREVAERTEAQRAMELYAAEVRDLYEHAPCGYHSLDPAGVFGEINDTELAWLGYTRDEVVGRMAFPDICAPSSRETFALNFPQFRDRGYVKDLEFEILRKDGSTFHVLLSAVAIKDDQGTYVKSRSTLFDISDLFQAREQVAVRTAALEAANRELESFSYSVSHDLRAPLRAIDGFSRILAETYSDRLDTEAQRLLGVVCTNTRRMGRLIDDLLTFSRMGRTEMRMGKVDMRRLVDQAMAEACAGFDLSRVEFTVLELPAARGDESMLRQVWVNLLANALKFSSSRQAPAVIVSGKREGREAVYEIKDNGVGFDMQYAGKLFGVFQRLHRQQEFPGTGVGLALSQRIINRHGGKITAESRVGEGATFLFRLPAWEP